MSSTTPQKPSRPRNPLPNTLSHASSRSFGTPRRRKAPRSTRLQGVKPVTKTDSETSAELISKLNLQFAPDAWQVQLISRITRGYDSIFVAGTGYGKSLIFQGLAALGGAKKTVVIISPLKALERDQAEKNGLKAMLINEDNTKDPSVWCEARTKAQMIYISPEMAPSANFIDLWKFSKFRKRDQAIIIDEAHCIEEWATFEIIYKSLAFGHRPFWGIDVGCDRPNLLFATKPLVNRKNPILDILNLLPAHLNHETPRDAIPKGLCYYDSEAASMGAHRPRPYNTWDLLLVPPWAFRPKPPAVGAAVQRVKGRVKLKVEPKTRTAQRERLEKSLEAFINSEGCLHKLMSETFHPHTGLTTYLGLSSNAPVKPGKHSEVSPFELSWTVLNLDRSPPRNRCCHQCNPQLVNQLMPSNKNDPRLVQFASEFLNPFPDAPPTRPPSQPSTTSNVSHTSITSDIAALSATNFEPIVRSTSKDEKEHRRLLLDWRNERHHRSGSDIFLSPAVALPPSRLAKLVLKGGQFLKESTIGRREILKVISWDFATDDDFKE
ncbi:hypothetical protein DXG03_009288, partial [Asterophora parasitica]